VRVIEIGARAVNARDGWRPVLARAFVYGWNGGMA